MNAKKAKKIRKAMLTKTGDNVAYGFTTTSSYNHLGLKFKFTYHSLGERQLYKLGKKIFNRYGILPLEGKDASK